MVICGVWDDWLGERESFAEEAEEGIPLVARSEVKRGIGVTSDEDRGSWMLLSQIINASFKQGEFPDKLSVETSCREVYREVDGERMIWVVEYERKEPARWDSDCGDELVQVSPPENKDTPMCMTSGEGDFWV